MDCAFCYYPNDEDARFCARCAAALGVPLDRLPSEAPPAPAADDLAAIEALAAGSTAGSHGRALPVLGGRYRLVRCLGSGGFGAVYEAEEVDTGLRVAVKLLNHTALHDSRMRERFLQEARMIAELRSPHVVRLYDYAVTPLAKAGDQPGVDGPGGIPYLVMELIAGRNLGSLLMRGVLSARRTLHILAQVAAALGEAHGLGIVHRDIKPDNILLMDPVGQSGPGASHGFSDGGKPQDFVKVIDFGVARLCGPATRPSDVLGTPAFIAPETLANEPVDGRCDLYALGILLWQMILGELPFPAANQAVMMSSHLSAPRRRPSEVYPHLRGRLPVELEKLMVWLIARQPADRPAAAFEVRAQLLALLPRVSDEPLAAAPLPNFGPCWDSPEPAPEAAPGSIADPAQAARSAGPTERQPAPNFRF